LSLELYSTMLVRTLDPPFVTPSLDMALHISHLHFCIWFCSPVFYTALYTLPLGYPLLVLAFLWQSRCSSIHFCGSWSELGLYYVISHLISPPTSFGTLHQLSLLLSWDTCSSITFSDSWPVLTLLYIKLPSVIPFCTPSAPHTTCHPMRLCCWQHSPISPEYFIPPFKCSHFNSELADSL